MPYVITSDCQQCGACAAGCESKAIQEGPDKTTIDITICVECGVCADNCPFQAIVFEEELEANLSA
jgi:ferredoxin